MLPKKVALFPVTPHPATVKALGDLQGSVQDVRDAIAAASTVWDAYQLYLHVRAMAELLNTLTDEAGARAEHLLSEL